MKEPIKSSKARSASAPPVRPLRRGEFKGVACNYVLGSFDEFSKVSTCMFATSLCARTAALSRIRTHAPNPASAPEHRRA